MAADVTERLLSALVASKCPCGHYFALHHVDTGCHGSDDGDWTRCPCANDMPTAVAAALRPVVDDLIDARVAEVVGRVEAAIVSAAPPINSELLYDGREDPVGAAYVEGFRDAWQAVVTVRAALAGTGEQGVGT